MTEELTVDQESEGGESVYIDVIKGEETREESLQRTILDRGRIAFAAFSLLAVSVCGNVYQMRQVRIIPYINTVSEQGEVVSRLLLRPEEIPQDDPYRQAFIRDQIEKWIVNYRTRSSDKKTTAMGITSVIRASAGPALVKVRAEIKPEDLFEQIKKETVHVILPEYKPPIHLIGDSWQTEWEEVTTSNNSETRRKFSATFQIAQQDDWIAYRNPYGIRIVNFTPQGGATQGEKYARQ